MIYIINKEWFDKVNGNTYFSAKVYLGEDLIMSIPYQYGYSEFCKQVLNKALREHFKIDEKSSVYEVMNKNGIKLSITTLNVKKRELDKEAFQDFTPFLKNENLALYAAHRMREGIALDHHTMENVFIDWLTSDGIGITFANGSNELYSFNSFNWF